MEYILKELPNLILYFSSGYVFTRVYSLVRVVDVQKDFQNVFIKCVVSGFIIKNLISLVPIRSNYYLNILGLVIASGVIAYVGARIISASIFVRLLKSLRIRRTTNEYFWSDIIDQGKTVWVRAICNETDLDYFGILVVVEDYPRFPQIVLSNYLKRTMNGEIIEDCYLSPEKRVIIDTSKCEIIELIYESSSEKIKEVKKKTMDEMKEQGV